MTYIDSNKKKNFFKNLFDNLFELFINIRAKHFLKSYIIIISSIKKDWQIF